MHTTGNNRGYTLVEMVTALMIMGLLATGATSMMYGAMKTCDYTTLKANTDVDAMLAMQKIVLDVREARTATPMDPGPNTGNRLRIVQPKMIDDLHTWKYYDRNTLDTAGAIDYYLSDSTGALAHTGTYLWRSTAGQRLVVARNVKLLQFDTDPDNPQSHEVQITIDTQSKPLQWRNKPLDTLLTQRVVYMRNY